MPEDTQLSAGDMVYYLYSDRQGTPIKCPARVISLEAKGVLVRVGRFDVHRKQVSTFESVVSPDSLQVRTLACAFESELQDAV